jgi:hypothetical protein
MKDSIRRYRHWYRNLLRLHSTPFRDRFGEGMEQTFHDLLLERAREGRGLFACAFRMFVETSMGILREKTIMNAKSMIRVALATAFLLLVPLVAMQLTDEVVWGPLDFGVAGFLLFGAGLTYERVARKQATIVYRLAVGAAVGSALFLVWANLAVGLIGDEGNPANLLYGAVLATGLIGAILARSEAQGMARALFAMALVQALVPVIAVIVWKYPVESSEEALRVLGVTAFFVVLFVGSALLFRRAARAAISR